MAQSVKQIKMLSGMFSKLFVLLIAPSLILSLIFSSFPPLPLSVLPKYVSLYSMWHRRIGLSEAGNDFFCSYFCVERDQSSAGYQAIYYPASSPLSCLGKCNLPWFTQLPQDRERKRNISCNSIVGQTEFREMHKEKGHFSAFLARNAVCMCTRVVCLNGVKMSWSSTTEINVSS